MSLDYAAAGFRVGKYIDGGYSLYGHPVGSSQIEDYYTHKNALTDHAHDYSWFPDRIEDSIFDLKAYIVRQWAAASRDATAQTTKQLTVLSANVEDMKFPPLEAALKATTPTVGVFQQSTEANNYLRSRKPYRLYAFSKGTEARGVKALVSGNTKVAMVKRLNMVKRWVGPKTGKHHSPRTYMALLLLTPFKAWVINVHFPTGGPHGPNAEAWAESWGALINFLAKRRGVAAGDFNATAEELAPLCKRAGLDLTSIGKVDHAVSHHLRRVSVDRSLPGKPSGVHGWGTVTYEPSKEK